MKPLVTRAEYLFDDYAQPEDVFDLEESKITPLDSDEIYQRQIRSLEIPDPIEVIQLSEFKIKGETAKADLKLLDFLEVPRKDEVLQIQATAEAGPIAAARLIEGHLRLAAHIARLSMGWVPYGSERYKKSGESIFHGARIKDLSIFASYSLPLADRIQAANVGLIKAARNYDANKGAFTTYAFHWIESAIEEAIVADRNIKIPIGVYSSLGRVSLHPQLLREDIFPEVHSMGHSQDDIKAKLRYLLCIARQTASLEELENREDHEGDFDPDEDTATFSETVLDGGYADDDEGVEGVEHKIRSEKIRDVLDLLPYRENLILKARFGFDGRVKTLEDTGHELDLTRERVRQLESQALARLGGLTELRSIVEDEQQKQPKEQAAPHETRLQFRMRMQAKERRLMDAKATIAKFKSPTNKWEKWKKESAEYSIYLNQITKYLLTSSRPGSVGDESNINRLLYSKIGDFDLSDRVKILKELSEKAGNQYGFKGIYSTDELSDRLDKVLQMILDSLTKPED